MHISWQNFVVGAIVTVSVVAVAGNAVAQTKSGSERVPTPNLEVGRVGNLQTGKRGSAGFGMLHGAQFVAEGEPALPKPPFPQSGPSRGSFGTFDTSNIMSRRRGDDVAIVGVLQQPGEKSKYMYIILVDNGNESGVGSGFAGGVGGKPDPRNANRFQIEFRIPTNRVFVADPQGDSPAQNSARGQQGRRGTPARANEQEPPTVRGRGFGSGIVGGAPAADSKGQFVFFHEFEIERTSGRLKTLSFKLNETVMKKGAPQVYLADLSGEKLQLTGVDVALPEEALDLHEKDQATWGASLKKTIDHLRENSKEVDEFMNKRRSPYMLKKRPGAARGEARRGGPDIFPNNDFVKFGTKAG